MTEVSKRIDYLQRLRGSQSSMLGLPSHEMTVGEIPRRILRVRAIGKESDNTKRPMGEKERERLPAESLLAALYAFAVPFCFRVSSEGSMMHFEFGTWHKDNGRLDLQEDILKSSLRAVSPAIRLESPAVRSPNEFEKGAYVLGIPSVTTSSTSRMPLDEVIRGAGLGHWSFTIIAEPINISFMHRLRSELFAELSEVSAELHHEHAPNEIASNYIETLKIQLADYNLGVTQGAWRTAVYLCGKRTSFYLLAAAWSGVFSGAQSISQPIQIYSDVNAVVAAEHWLLPDISSPERPPGHFRHHLALQSILPTHSLAAYCQLPEREVPGLRIFEMPRLDLEPGGLSVGPVLGRVIRHPEEFNIAFPNEVGTPFRVNPAELTSHALVVGSTGSGKTTTLHAILNTVADAGHSFLIIEPAKTEYRKLMTAPWCKTTGINVLTLGAEDVAPLRMNPFQPASSLTPIATHIDLLRSTFAASFGMWTPLPQILERSIYAVYSEKGWNLVTNKNARVAPGERVPAEAWPTLTDLILKVEQVINALGYDRKVADDMRAALLTRLQSLRIGAKGAMLDTNASIDMAKLLDTPTVLELERLGDDDDKAFVMGLVMILLLEHLRTSESSNKLRHLLVIEEAHRLLRQAEATGRAEDASPRAKAVETFSNMLSEVRAYGEGIVIVDQSPSILAPSTIKNTNLKLVHRLVSAEDKAAMAASLGLQGKEDVIFGGLQSGFALAMGQYDDRPMILKIKKAVEGGSSPDDKQVRAQFDLRNPELRKQIDERQAEGYDEARQISETAVYSELFGRIVLALTDPEFVPDELMQSLQVTVAGRVTMEASTATIFSGTLQIASQRFAMRRGAARAWSYQDTRDFGTALSNSLWALHMRQTTMLHQQLSVFRSIYTKLHLRATDAFAACTEVCPSQSSARLCAFREFVNDLKSKPEGTLANVRGTFNECLDLTKSLIPNARALRGPSHKALALCFAQHQFSSSAYYDIVRFVEDAKNLQEGVLNAE